MSKAKEATHWPLTILMGFSSLLNLFLPLFLVRVLTSEQVGNYKLFFLYLSTAPLILFSNGFSNVLYYWVGQPHEKRQKALSATWQFHLLWTLLILIIGLSTVNIFFKTANFNFLTHFELNLLILAIAFSISSSFYEESQIALGHTRFAAWYSAFWEFSRSALMIFVCFTFKTTEALFLTYFLVVFIKFLISFVLILKNKANDFSLRPNELNKSVFSLAWPSSLASAMGVLLGYSDQFLLSTQLSASEFAIYTLGCLSVPPLLIFEQSVNKVMIPKLAKSFNQNEKTYNPQSLQIFKLAIQELGLWLIPASFGLYFYSKEIVAFLFDHKYPQAAEYLSIYCFFYPLFLFPFDSWARALGQTKWILKPYAIFIIFSLTMTYLGSQFYGAKGVLFGFLLAHFLLRIYSLFEIKKILQWPIREYFPWTYLFKVITLSLIFGSFSSYLVQDIGSPFFRFCLGGFTFSFFYLIFGILGFLKIKKSTESGSVLILTQYFHIGGLERMIVNLSQGLFQNKRFTPHILYYDIIEGQQTIHSQVDDGIPVQYLSKKNGFSLKLAFQIAKYLRKQDIKIIHCHDLGALIYGVMAKIILLNQIKLIYTQHSFIHLKKSKFYIYYEIIFNLFSDAIIGVSEDITQTYKEFKIFNSKIRTIQNGIPHIEITHSPFNRKEFLKKQNLNQFFSGPTLDYFIEKKWLLYLARINPGKGQDIMIHIWNQFPQEIQKDSILFIVGNTVSESFQKKLIDLKEKSNFQENIFLIGSTQTPIEWIKHCDFFISCSEFEGMPLAPLESLACHKTTLLSNIEGHKMYESASLFFDLNDIELASAVIAKNILNPPEQSLLFQKNIKLLLNKFSSERMVQEYEKVYLS